MTERHPLKGIVTDIHREHLYGREYDTSREIRKEGGPSKLSLLIEQFTNALKDIEDAKKREAIRKLVDDIAKSSLGYINARISHILALSWAESDKNGLERLDRLRQTAHSRLADAIKIATRNLVKEATGFQLDETFTDLVGEYQDVRVRQGVEKAAIDFVWELLIAEEEEKRTARPAA